jgi:hypothetical protein
MLLEEGRVSVPKLPLAYLDPGSGSVLLQLLLGGIAAVGVTARLYWRRVQRALRLRRAEED